MTTLSRNRRRRLIVNADDFGLSTGVNDGIMRCFERGVVTSTSLMVRWPAAAAAAARARVARRLSVGLHIDLGEWEYRSGQWLPLYDVVALDDQSSVRAEIGDQLQTFRRLMRQDPTHLDSHQHMHHRDGIRDVVTELSERLGVPVRQPARREHAGGFYGQDKHGEMIDNGISVRRLVQILTALPNGTAELGCHPGLRNDVQGMYVCEREQEVRVLCDPVIRATIDAEDIALISFHDLAPDDFPIAAV